MNRPQPDLRRKFVNTLALIVTWIVALIIGAKTHGVVSAVALAVAAVGVAAMWIYGLRVGTLKPLWQRKRKPE